MVHLMFSTYYFGVNNKWKSNFRSMFGVPIYKRTPRKIRQNYYSAKFRALEFFFISEEEARILFPNHFKKKKYNSTIED